MRARACVRMRVSVCVCVYLYICVCMHVCMYLSYVCKAFVCTHE
jgi:hypothetical protein